MMSDKDDSAKLDVVGGDAPEPLAGASAEPGTAEPDGAEHAASDPGANADDQPVQPGAIDGAIVSAPPASIDVPGGTGVVMGPPMQPPFLRTIFHGPNGIRAGWRVLIYLVVLVAITTVLLLIVRKVFGVAPQQGQPMRPGRLLVMETIAFGVIAAAALVMTRIEREKWGHYGLPLRRALRLDFRFGCLWGFVALSCVLGVLRLAGAYHIDGLAITGVEALKYGVLWAVFFLFVGLFEEFFLRGYLLYTLASGIGFWPAAVVTSALFMAGHIRNSGENWLGLADVFVIAMFFCLTVWRTGDLWFAVGLHAAWDWGQTFFYSVPDSGMVAAGHLLRMHVQGPAWLSGGSVGPEGSVVSVASHVVFFAVFVLIYKQRKWVGMKPVGSRQAAAISTAYSQSPNADEC